MSSMLGRVALSLKGHDKDSYFIILKEEGEYVYLADGKLRMLDKPKKKKKKHLEISSYISDDILEKLTNAQKILNSDIRKALELYKNKDAKGE